MNRSLNKVILTLALAAACIMPAVPAMALDDPSPAGAWDGTIHIPGAELAFTATFVETDSGLTATVDIPAQGAYGMPVEIISLVQDSIAFALTGVPGDPTFTGLFDDNGKLILGAFSQGGQEFTFSMMYLDDADRLKEAGELEQKLSDLRQFIDTTMAVWKVPGVSVAIVRNGDVILSEGFGLRNVEDSLPLTPQTLLAIGSSTKAFTTMVLGMLADDGLVGWDERVIKYLPDFRLKDEYITNRMTVRDLVTHRSGLPRHDLMWYGSDYSRRELYDRLQYLDFSKDFRTTWQYQNLMFLTAGILAGEVSGTSWEDLVTDRILQPLGMTATNLSVKDTEKSEDFALGYSETDDTLTLMPFRNIDELAPAGAINSNADDMAKWLQFLLQKGKFGDATLVSEPTFTEMYSPQIPIGRPGTHTERLLPSYGLGWFIEAYRGHYRVHHGGNIDGFSALVSFMPYDGFGIVVLVNKNASPLPGLITLYATDLLLDLEPVDFHGRARAAIAAADSTEEASKSDSDEGRIKGTKPSHKLEEYVGDYEHRAYGAISITLDGKQLAATMRDSTSALTHWHYDIFRVDDNEGAGQGRLLLAFTSNIKGDIDALSVVLDPNVDAIVFTRKASDKLSDTTYLDQFVGTYELDGTAMKVARQGDKLTVTVPGQPTYTLAPYKENEFNFADLSGFSTVFKVEDGVATELAFHQPNGVFTATRVTEK